MVVLVSTVLDCRLRQSHALYAAEAIDAFTAAPDAIDCTGLNPVGAGAMRLTGVMGLSIFGKS